jgi:hypothetical protein
MQLKLGWALFQDMLHASEYGWQGTPALDVMCGRPIREGDISFKLAIVWVPKSPRYRCSPCQKQHSCYPIAQSSPTFHSVIYPFQPCRSQTEVAWRAWKVEHDVHSDTAHAGNCTCHRSAQCTAPLFPLELYACPCNMVDDLVALVAVLVAQRRRGPRIH